MPIVLHPRDRDHWLALRREDITSTEMSALFGLSPYATAFELYHQKIGAVDPEFEPSERMEWGLRLQPVVMQAVAERTGYKVRALNSYMRHTDVPRMGASFDAEIVGHDRGPGILEIKVVDRIIFRDQWAKNDDGSFEAPAHIEIQIQSQMEVSNRGWGLIAVLVGGNQLELLERNRDPEMGEQMARQVVKFWGHVETRKAPEPDFEKDAGFISRLYWDGSGPVYDARGDGEVARLLAEYRYQADMAKAAELRKDAAKAELLMKIGDASRVVADNFTVSCATVGETEVSYTRKAYRNWRVTPVKMKG